MTTHSVTGVTEDLVEVLRSALAEGPLISELRAGPLAEVDPEIAERVLANAEKIRTSLLGAVAVIPIPEEAHRALACSYLELKAQWLQRNVRLSYEGFVTGSWDAETAADGAVIGHLLLKIEPLIDPAHVQQIHELFVNQLPD